MMIGSLVRFASKTKGWIPAVEFVESGKWRNGLTEGEWWNIGDVGMIVDIIPTRCRKHRKAVMMRDNKFFIIALKHLEQIGKNSLKRKKEESNNDV